jgi:hypothetical protein
MGVVNAHLGHPMKQEEKASMLLAGGLMTQGYQCGMVWGGALAAGAQAFELYGPGPKAVTAALLASQRLVESFRTRNKYVDCGDIIEFDWKGSSDKDMVKKVLKFFLKGGPIGCFRMAAKYAPLAVDDINTSFSQDDFEVPSPPVSCTALLAQQMGLSEKHTVMAAGLAGGIGFSGSACGALGLVIWVLTMRDLEAGVKIEGFSYPKGKEAVEVYLESADYEFDCAGVVGRKFESVADHAAYLSGGGCAQIIEALAAL